MKTRTLPKGTNLKFYMPEKSDIQALQVGDTAMNCFGNFGRVKEIAFRGIDINNKEFVGFYIELDQSAMISESWKEGELIRTVELVNRYKSCELDKIEQEMRNN